MLTTEENRALTHVGPGTVMGELLRRYWIPAMLAEDLPGPNGDPARIRLVGENFVVWRDAAGRLGLFDEYCMHRGASLALGRCEGDGLRCLYHGWKFAVDGTILETPNYKKPTVREKLRAPTYPVREAGGLLWVYLGPKACEPPFPHYKCFDLPADQMPIYHATVDCNWMQVMEGTIDPSHANILHQDTLGERYTNSAKLESGDRALTSGQYEDSEPVVFVAEDNAPRLEVEDTTFGCHGVAIFDALTEDNRSVNFVRPHAWVMPFLALPYPLLFVLSVPVDDYRTAFFAVHAEAMPDQAERERFLETTYAGPLRHYDEHHYKWGEAERWGQDRSRMATSFTGVDGVVPEDLAMSLSMSPLFDRSRENLVPADVFVIRVRRRLLEAARQLQEGVEPFMLEPEDATNLGGRWSVMSDPSQWQERLLPSHTPFRLAQRQATAVEA